MDKVKEDIELFLKKNKRAAFIECVIDTTVDPDSDDWDHIPFLNLYVWKIGSKTRFIKAFREAKKYDDYGFLFDVCQEIDSSDFKINLSDIYPSWPKNVDKGDNMLIKMLKSAVKDKTVALNQASYVIFHHIDDWPALNLRTGKPFRL